ncbi:uncharacterized protein YraI [Streptomyces phaeochromogenes]|jgi:uncharacterized protein YraI|uniref:SH3 domain-containing protein n=2 Tax=Streptomyces TaxID=1883 RepID=UPI00163DC00A|nr:uncharacterized protein YraI [Streptomyces phaeochromogenes]
MRFGKGRGTLIAGAAAGAFLMVMGSPTSANAAAARAYPIAPGYTVNVRSGPGTGYSIVGTLRVGSSVRIYCQTPGETISGPYGTTNIWDNVANGEYVSDAYVNTGSDGYVAARCG